MIIPEGYYITIIARGEEIIADIDLEGYDLEKSIARADLMNDIQRFVEDYMRFN